MPVVGGVVGGEEAEVGQRVAKGALAASLLRRLGDFDLRFFPADVLGMGWFVSCAVGELKGWREGPDFRWPAQNSSPRLYPYFPFIFNSH